MIQPMVKFKKEPLRDVCVTVHEFDREDHFIAKRKAETRDGTSGPIWPRTISVVLLFSPACVKTTHEHFSLTNTILHGNEVLGLVTEDSRSLARIMDGR